MTSLRSFGVLRKQTRLSVATWRRNIGMNPFSSMNADE
jgi:hypothetical protein